jgi:hypothetical protein
MRKILVAAALVGVSAFLVSASWRGCTPKKEYPLTTRIVTAKEKAGQAVYRLRSTRGELIEVSPEEWRSAEVGKEFSSREWARVDGVIHSTELSAPLRGSERP